MPLLLAASLLLCAKASAQTAAPSPSPHSLKLSAEVVGRSLCRGEGGTDFLHLRVRLRYLNAGASRLIVYRGGNLFFQVLVHAAGAPAPGGSGYELKTTSARYATREPERVDAPAPNRDFALLRPGASFETEVPVTLPVTPAGAPRAVGSITAGPHELRLSVSTWYESRDLGERLRERWRQRGHLWTAPVGTAPVPFDTDAQRPARPCEDHQPR